MRLVFVTDRQDAHAARFSELFASLGADYEHVQVQGHGSALTAGLAGTTVSGWDALKSALAASPTVVVSGPLDTVTAHLVGGDYRHVGISWATDVMVTAAQSAEDARALSETLQSLDLVVLDNYATENAVVALGAAPDRVCRIPWGPEGTAVTPLERSALGIPEDAFVIVYPRSLEPHYQPEVFLDAVAKLAAERPGVRAVLVESGSMVDSVKRDLTRLGVSDHIVWLPLRSPQEFQAIIAMADAVVVTTRTDGTSVTVMDAMHHRVPVVTSLTNGSAEWILGGVTGWTFPVGDAHALAEALESVASVSFADRALITGNARRLVDQRAGWSHSAATLGSEIKKLFTS
jgi:glycosyltransferase involved in cell wall biosynthesis